MQRYILYMKDPMLHTSEKAAQLPNTYVDIALSLNLFSRRLPLLYLGIPVQ